MNQENKSGGLQASPVPIPDAAKETFRWREFIRTVAPQDPSAWINGYFIPIDDINSIMGYAVNGARVYFAMREDSSIHLYIVPVDGNGDDILENSQDESLVYDTTLPCPNMCGSPNELNSNQ